MTGAAGGRWTAGLPGVLELPAGERWRHPLPSAAGAGGSWRAELVAGDRACAEVRVEAGPAPPPPARPGGPPPATFGVPETLVVRARDPGRAAWRLRLARPWAPDEPVAEHLLEVHVHPAAGPR